MLASAPTCCEEHCVNCNNADCAGLKDSLGCDVVPCPYGCGSRLHSCKIRDHAEICAARARPCPCAQWGCFVLLSSPADVVEHLKLCPAAPVICYLCAHLCRRCDLASHLQHVHRENGVVFEHCPLRNLGCDFCLARQLPEALKCVSTRSHDYNPANKARHIHRELLRAVAAHTNGTGLIQMVRWQQASAPAHLVEYLHRNGTCTRHAGLIHRWSSTTDSDDANGTIESVTQLAAVTTMVECSRPHLGGGDGRQQLAFGSSRRRHQSQQHCNQTSGHFNRNIQPASFTDKPWPLHGSIEPPPLPVSREMAAPLAVPTSAALKIGFDNSGGHRKSEEASNSSTVAVVLKLHELPYDVLAQVVCHLGDDGLSWRAFAGVCRTLRAFSMTLVGFQPFYASRAFSTIKS